MNTSIKINTITLGYSDFFESGRIGLGFADYQVARITAEYKEAYRALTPDGIAYYAKVTGKQMHDARKREDYPAVGDWVAITPLEQNKAVIRGILPRKSILTKKYSNKQETQIIASNIDTAFITESMDRDYNLNRLERFMVLTEEGGIQPTVILNKIDLIPDDELNFRMNQIKNRCKDNDVILTSIFTKEGTNELRNYITPGKTYCFIGSSGVGKSSLINALLGSDEIRTREISMTLEKGRHTTTTREMYFTENGGILIDNPGTREVGMAGADTGIEGVFDEISLLSQKCKFSDCTHTSEPGCAVIKAVREDALDREKYSNFVKLKKESDFYKMTDLEKREKDRKFGKYVKKVLQELKS